MVELKPFSIKLVVVKDRCGYDCFDFIYNDQREFSIDFDDIKYLPDYVMQYYNTDKKIRDHINETINNRKTNTESKG